VLLNKRKNLVLEHLGIGWLISDENHHSANRIEKVKQYFGFALTSSRVI
jgi:hypothetical protein